MAPRHRCPRCSLLRVVSPPPQRACYLSINPQKDEALETEKVQYTLPDGSTLDVSGQALEWQPMPSLGEGVASFSRKPVCLNLVHLRWGLPDSGPPSCCSSRTL